MRLRQLYSRLFYGKGDHFLLNGSKTYISNGINGGAFVVAARTVADKPHGIGLFVEAGGAGRDIEPALFTAGPDMYLGLDVPGVPQYARLQFGEFRRGFVDTVDDVATIGTAVARIGVALLRKAAPGAQFAARFQGVTQYDQAHAESAASALLATLAVAGVGHQWL